MKKTLAIMLCIVMLLSFAACGSKSETDAGDEGTAAQVNSEETTAPADVKQEFSEVTLIDNDQLTFTVKDMYAEEGYTTLKVVIQNNTDKNYCYSIDKCSIDGIYVENDLYTEIVAGKKAVETFWLYDEEILRSGYTQYTDIEMELIVQEDLLSEPVYTETVHIYPMGQQNAKRYERQAAATDVVLVETEDIVITAIGSEFIEDEQCFYLNLFIENKSDINIEVNVETASINDIMLDPYYYTVAYADTVAFSSIIWFADELAEKDIEAVESIELDFKGYEELELMDYEDILNGDVNIDDLLGYVTEPEYLFEKTVVYNP